MKCCKCNREITSEEFKDKNKYTGEYLRRLPDQFGNWYSYCNDCWIKMRVGK